MNKKRFRAAAAQTLARLGDVKHNIEVAAQLVNEAVRQGAELVVLPECMNTGYLFDSAEHCRALAERVPDGPFGSAISALAREHGIFVASGITEWDDTRGRIFNSGIMFDRNGKLAVHYHKQFLATHDQNWFSFGERGCPVVDTDLGRIGLMICFDGRIPEIARSLALQGAEIIVDMANFFAMDQADMWGPARCYENGVWLVAATKAGYERSIYYPGGSMIVDPNGRVAAKMPYDRHGVIVADVSPEFAREKPIYSANDKFADRRPSTYGMLVEDYRDLPVAKTAHEPIVPALHHQGGGSANPCRRRRSLRGRLRDARSRRQARRAGPYLAGIRADRDLGAECGRSRARRRGRQSAHRCRCGDRKAPRLCHRVADRGA